MTEGSDDSGKEKILKDFSDRKVRILNLCHIPEDGRLKTLSFWVPDEERLEEILDYGERVDGSNLFSFVEPAESDIYIMPDAGKFFADPFSAIPAVNVLCDYLDREGKPLEAAPKNVLARAEKRLYSSTDVTLKALVELEFYIMAKIDGLFPASPDRNYHESSPFTKFQDVRNEILGVLDLVAALTKYAHGEIGLICGKNDTLVEQHEIEFKPQGLTRMAETVAIAKWVVRNVCARHSVSASFIPKIDLNHAGNGMHVHTCALKKGNNIVANNDRTISREALEIIGGMLRMAPSLAAFGNPTPVSYLRFVARKETPMHVCWSARNRLALIRVPLWWDFKKRSNTQICRETFEYRAPDAFANAYLLFAGLALAAGNGLENPKESLRLAEDLHVESGETMADKLDLLPRSCFETAENLRRDRSYYEANGVFPHKLIDETIRKLKAFEDENMWRDLNGKPERIESSIAEYLHYG